MGSRYLTDLATVCRRTGANVLEVDGWQTRARGSGGYATGCPSHVMVHHTASPPSTDGAPDVDYICFNADAAPLANLYLDRSGTIWVCAAGATNTNGTGTDPCGWTAPDSMNAEAIGIEAANGGTGEPWPTVQLDTYTDLSAVLCAAYAIPPSRVHGHAEWAPGRKTDPAGPPRYATGPATWNMAAFRADIHGPDPTPQPPQPPEDDVTPFIITNTATGQPAIVYGAGLLTGIAGPDLEAYEARFGRALPTAPDVWSDYVAKSNALTG